MAYPAPRPVARPAVRPAPRPGYSSTWRSSDMGHSSYESSGNSRSTHHSTPVRFSSRSETSSRESRESRDRPTATSYSTHHHHSSNSYEPTRSSDRASPSSHRSPQRPDVFTEPSQYTASQPAPPPPPPTTTFSPSGHPRLPQHNGGLLMQALIELQRLYYEVDYLISIYTLRITSGHTPQAIEIDVYEANLEWRAELNRTIVSMQTLLQFE